MAPTIPNLKKIELARKHLYGRKPIVFPPAKDKKEQQREIEDGQQLEFMQECRERTAAMKDEAKCDLCKLRFRCYTEIKIRKKLKRKPKPEPDDFDEVIKLYVKDFGKRSINLES